MQQKKNFGLGYENLCRLFVYKHLQRFFLYLGETFWPICCFLMLRFFYTLIVMAVIGRKMLSEQTIQCYLLIYVFGMCSSLHTFGCHHH